MITNPNVYHGSKIAAICNIEKVQIMTAPDFAPLHPAVNQLIKI